MQTAQPAATVTSIPADIGKTADALFASIDPADAGGAEGNVLLSDYAGPYGGVPHFDRMDLAGMKSALEAGMARSLAEVDAIANNPEPAHFANTIVAFASRSSRWCAIRDSAS